MRARWMSVSWIEGNTLVHQNIKTCRRSFLAVIQPYQEDLAVAVECIFTWYWIADLCGEQRIAFVLGHALYRRAIHGGKAKNDKIDSQKIALLLKGGLIPQAYAYPPERRATRDLLRRRMQRADLIAHIQNTVSTIYHRWAAGSAKKVNARRWWSISPILCDRWLLSTSRSSNSTTSSCGS